MLREMVSSGRGELGASGLSGLEITGLVVALICAGLLLWIGPELVRYVKISRM